MQLLFAHNLIDIYVNEDVTRTFIRRSDRVVADWGRLLAEYIISSISLKKSHFNTCQALLRKNLSIDKVYILYIDKYTEK